MGSAMLATLLALVNFVIAPLFVIANEVKQSMLAWPVGDAVMDGVNDQPGRWRR
jgi:hypothetical protein